MSSQTTVQLTKPVRKNYYVKKTAVWAKEEDEKLLALVNQHGVQKFRKISTLMGKTVLKCHQRYYQLQGLDSYDNNRKWTREEDAILTQMVQKEGEKKWQKVAEALPGRLPKQCRERWLYRINPEIVKDKWTIEEEVKLLKLYQEFGSKWSKISTYFSGRTDAHLKNRFNQSLKKRIACGEFDQIMGRKFAITKQEEESESQSQSSSKQFTFNNDEEEKQEAEIKKTDSSSNVPEEEYFSESNFFSANKSSNIQQRREMKLNLKLAKKVSLTQQNTPMKKGESFFFNQNPITPACIEDSLMDPTSPFMQYKRAKLTQVQLPSFIRQQSSVFADILKPMPRQASIISIGQSFKLNKMCSIFGEDALRGFN